MEKDVAIFMADLTGYTAMTDVHGGASAAKIVHKYMQLVGKSVCGTTQVVQRIGDQVVMISDEPYDIAMTALQLNAYTLEEHHFLSIHAGIHYGSIFQEDGNLFGSTINIAARIMNLANRGQILCSASFVNKMPTNQPALSFMPFGKHKLKNVIHELEIFELNNTVESTLFYMDPVCRMHINPEKTVHTYTFQDQTFHFCSSQCLELFKTSPETFMSS